MTLLQEGSDVVATGSGTINTADLDLVLMGGSSAGLIFPMDAIIYTGPSEIIDAYAGAIAGPTSFGSGPGGFANADSEDLVGISEPHYLKADLAIVRNGQRSCGNTLRGIGASGFWHVRSRP